MNNKDNNNQGNILNTLSLLQQLDLASSVELVKSNEQELVQLWQPTPIQNHEKRLQYLHQFLLNNYLKSNNSPLYSDFRDQLVYIYNQLLKQLEQNTNEDCFRNTISILTEVLQIYLEGEEQRCGEMVVESSQLKQLVARLVQVGCEQYSKYAERVARQQLRVQSHSIRFLVQLVQILW